jgi:hypothetical protein
VNGSVALIAMLALTGAMETELSDFVEVTSDLDPQPVIDRKAIGRARDISPRGYCGA